MSTHLFACHMAGADQPLTCAGFLLSSSADHNLSVRLARIRRGGLEDIHPGEAQLFSSYRAMAEANGVPADDPVLEACR